MMHTRAGKRKSQRGSFLVEVTFSILILMSMLLGVMSFGMLLFAYNSVGNAAREGARYAVVHGSQSTSPATNADVTTVVDQYTPGLNPTALTVTTTWPLDNNNNPIKAPGNTVTVTVQYAFTFDISLVTIPALTLTSTSKMVILQ